MPDNGFLRFSNSGVDEELIPLLEAHRRQMKLQSKGLLSTRKEDLVENMSYKMLV